MVATIPIGLSRASHFSHGEINLRLISLFSQACIKNIEWSSKTRKHGVKLQGLDGHSKYSRSSLPGEANLEPHKDFHPHISFHRQGSNKELRAAICWVSLFINSLGLRSTADGLPRPSSRSKKSSLEIAFELANFCNRTWLSESPALFWSPKYWADEIDFALANFFCASPLSSIWTFARLELPVCLRLSELLPNSLKKSPAVIGFYIFIFFIFLVVKTLYSYTYDVVKIIKKIKI